MGTDSQFEIRIVCVTVCVLGGGGGYIISY